MERLEFTKWLETCTEYKKCGVSDDTMWKYVNDSYYDIEWFYLYISEEDVVTFSWVEKYWGGTSNREDEFTFDNFKRRFDEGSLTDY